MIRATKIPNLKMKKVSLDYSLQLWRAHQDMIWKLDYHPQNSLISGVSSDETVML